MYRRQSPLSQDEFTVDVNHKVVVFEIRVQRLNENLTTGVVSNSTDKEVESGICIKL